MNGKFSERLKELRTARGISQKQLGLEIGTTYSAVSYWEKGINEPKISYVIALCKYFDVTADYLLGLTDEI
ncbi:MAG: helix-turn-helix transcriptional regulator [Clostridia bacterium]|nr:helix-turn-helix transcriptional regulator [Clostridia bacterium]